RRIVTGHDKKGTSIVISDTRPEMGIRPGCSEEEAKIHQAAVLWGTNTFPNDISSTAFLAGQVPPSTKGGSILRAVDFGPGLSSPMHRTLSLDYGVVLFGDGVEMELDNGECVKVRAGDVIVQRGTIHAWHNRGTAWARLFFVLMDANPLKLGGEEMLEAGL
ncbi:hypothetical protein BKA61DRAFT_497102, partial [Leptodontidium sp. MPI-SDFR-AT-0119]